MGYSISGRVLCLWGSFALSTGCTACTCSASTTSETAAASLRLPQPTARTPQLQTVTSKTHRCRGLSDHSKQKQVSQVSKESLNSDVRLYMLYTRCEFEIRGVDPECLVWQTSHCWEIPLPWRQAQWNQHLKHLHENGINIIQHPLFKNSNWGHGWVHVVVIFNPWDSAVDQLQKNLQKKTPVVKLSL